MQVLLHRFKLYRSSRSPNGSQTDPPLSRSGPREKRGPGVGAPARWLPYPRYGSMQRRNLRGEKGPRSIGAIGLRPTAHGLEYRFRKQFRKSERRTVSVVSGEIHRKRLISEISETALQRLRAHSRNESVSRRTAAARASSSYTVARTVSPRSHECETMSRLARIHGKSTGFCNHSDTRVSESNPVDSVEGSA